MKSLVPGMTLVLVLASFSAAARAEDEPAQQQPSDFSGSFYATTAFALSSIDGVPPGFAANSYDLPILVGAEITLHGSRTGLDAWGDLHGGSATYGFDPLWGGGLGLGFHSKIADGFLQFKMGLLLEDQATLRQAPVGGSYLDIWRWGFVVKGDYTTGILQPFVSFKWWNTPNETIAGFEGIDTDVAWNDTYALTLGARVHLSLLMAEASLSMYSVGAVAIASKEFAYFIGQQPVLQPGVGVGVDIGRWEAWLRYSRAFPSRNDDATEYLYQTPAYYNDNLMVRSQLTADIRWKF